jgi:hypothetical protein
MTQFHYPLPESEPQSPLRGLSDETRTALTNIAMGQSVANLLLNLDGQPILEQLNPDFRRVVGASLQRSQELFIVTGMSSLHIPEIGSPELKVDWRQLQTGYEAMERLGLQPELVIGLEGQPLSFWKTLYSGLRQWQDDNQLDAAHRLLHQDDGDGLYVDSQLETYWDELIPNQLRWSVSVLPGTPKPPVLNIAYDGTDAKQAIPAELTNILQALSLTDTNSQKPMNPKLEKYLHLQATRIQLGQEPLDIETFSWLNSTFTNSNGKLAAPNGLWYPGHGRVYLHWREVGDRNGYLGSRPEVRDVVL